MDEQGKPMEPMNSRDALKKALEIADWDIEEFIKFLKYEWESSGQNQSVKNERLGDIEKFLKSEYTRNKSGEPVETYVRSYTLNWVEDRLPFSVRLIYFNLRAGSPDAAPYKTPPPKFEFDPEAFLKQLP